MAVLGPGRNWARARESRSEPGPSLFRNVATAEARGRDREAPRGSPQGSPQEFLGNLGFSSIFLNFGGLF